MHECLQTQGMSIYQHGEMVRDYFNDLVNHLEHDTPLQFEWRMPEWLEEYKELLLTNLMDREKIALYHLYHDAGKPRCLVVGEDGKRRFPNHAKVSYETWLEHSDDFEIAELIRMDMDVHLLSAEECVRFAERGQAATLLLTGLAEIHANASMFGGIASISFKSKWKHLNARGKRILANSKFTHGVVG